MSTVFDEKWWRLRLPLPADRVKWRFQRSGLRNNGKPWGLLLCYLDNRAVQERLDDVVGPGSWRNEFSKGPDGGVMCGLSIRVDGEWVTKYDGAPNTDVEGVKGGLSSAQKRAAVQWGIGRYLYDLGDSWADFNVDQRDRSLASAKIKGQDVRYKPPTLPHWALPAPTIDVGGKSLVIDNQANFDKVVSAVEYLGKNGLAKEHAGALEWLAYWMPEAL